MSDETPETRPLDEAAALRIENAHLERALHLERAERALDRGRHVLELAALAAGTAGWALDLANRRWVRPQEGPHDDARE